MEKKKIEQFISKKLFKRGELAELSKSIQEAMILKGATHFDADDSFGSSDKSYDYSFEFYSYRYETDEEFIERKERVEEMIRNQQILKDKQDKVEYERLKKKFEK